MSQVEISVRSRLGNITNDLQKIQKESQKVGDELQGAAKSIGKTHGDQIRKTGDYLGMLRRMGASTAKEIADDFKALLSLEGVASGLKLSDQFKHNVKATVELSDSVRRLGHVFDISKDRFSGFQAKLVRGLGDIGLSSESATRSLEGLAKTQVRGEENLMGYAKLAGELAATAGDKEGESNIAQGMAATLTAQGVSPNDMKAASALAEDLRRGFNATGASATEILGTMHEMFANMSQDFRKSLSTRAMVSLAVAQQVAGPQSTKFLEEYLNKSPLVRKAWEARGFKGVMGPQGLNVEKFRAGAKGVMDQYQGDPRLMAQTLGLSEDAAEGFVRLYESLDKVAEAQSKMQNATGSLTEQYKASRSASESFQASLNKTKAFLAEPLAWATQKGTEALSGAAETTGGAAAVTGGAAVLAAVLAGGGLRGILGAAKGAIKGSAYEAVTGDKVQMVNVMNATEIGLAAAAANPMKDFAGVMGGMLKNVGMIAGAGAAGYAIGTAINSGIEGTAVGNFLDKTSGDLGTAFGNFMERTFPTVQEKGKFNWSTGQYEREKPKAPSTKGFSLSENKTVTDTTSTTKTLPIKERVVEKTETKTINGNAPAQQKTNNADPLNLFGGRGQNVNVSVKVEKAQDFRTSVKTTRGTSQ